MKDNIKVRIVKFKNEYFTDYSKIGEDSWKNQAVSKTLKQAKRSASYLSDFYSIIGIDIQCI